MEKNISLEVSHYSIIRELGEGGMGVVYLAEDKKLKRQVALKFIAPRRLQENETRSRLIREAQASASLNHPNIATIHAIEEQGDQVFISMEYIEGQSLRELIESEELSLNQILDIGIQIASGLEAAHAKGFIHRDIKTSNIMINKAGQAKIMDFGLVKSPDSPDLTKTSALVGTVHYMSPEQLLDQGIDQRCDLWAFGVVLYEMITGHRPFEDRHEALVLDRILRKSPPSLFRHRGGIPHALETLVFSCLQKKPGERCQSAREVKAALEKIRLSLGSSGDFVPPRKIWVPRRWKSKRLVFGLAALFLLVLLFGLSQISSLRRWAGKILPDTHSMAEEMRFAILPFNIKGGDEEDRTYCDGLVEQISSHIVQMKFPKNRLLVIPAGELIAEGITSVKEARETFSLNLVVQASLHIFDNRFQLILNLIAAEKMQTLDSKTIPLGSRPLDELFPRAVEQTEKMLGAYLGIPAQATPAVALSDNQAAIEFYFRARGHLINYQDEEALDRAIELFNRAIAEDRTFAQAYVGLGEAYVRKYSFSKAPEHFKLAQSFAQKARELDPSSAHIALIDGIILQDTGEYERSLESFQKAVTLDPNNASAYREMGYSLTIIGRFEEAEQAIKKSISLEPGYWGGYSYLGWHYYYRADYEKAIQYYIEVTELAPGIVRAYDNLGGLYMKLGDYAKALEMLKIALALKPTASTFCNLAACQYYTGSFEEAYSSYKKAIALEKASSDLYGGLGDSCRHIPGRSAEASDIYRQALALGMKELAVNPKDAGLLSRLAKYQVHLGNRAEAEDMIARAHAVEPENPEVLLNCVRVCEYLGERDRALQAVESLVGLEGSVVELQSDPDFRSLADDKRFQSLVDKGRAEPGRRP